MSDIEINEQDRLHQLLCAYMLGEADAAERSEIEGALARDPALREERDRLEATIGMVKNSLGKDETLSYQATSEVTRAAAQLASGPTPAPRPILWYQSTSLRAAALIVAVVGASFLGWRAFVTRGKMSANLLTAKLEPASMAAGDKKPASQPSPVAEGEKSQLESVGYAQGDSADAASEFDKSLSQGSAVAATESKRAEQIEEQLRKLNESSLALRAAGLKDDLKAIDGAASPVALTGYKFDPPTAGQPNYGVGDPAQALALDGVDQLSAGQPTGNSGSDEYYLGKGEASAATGGTAIGVGASAGSTSTTYSRRRGRGFPAAVAPASPGVPRLAGAPGGGTISAKEKLGRANQLTPGDPFNDEVVDYEHEMQYVPTDVRQDLTKAAEILELESAKPADEPTVFEQVDRFKEGAKSGDDDAYRNQRQRRILTPEERQARIEEIIISCRRLPNERPRDMFFRFWGDNPFEWSANDRQSTFSMDVDTASYTLARKYLVENHLPEKAQIRTEEFVNYFKPDIAPPAKGSFTIATELAPSRFSNEGKWMLRVAVRGQEVAKNERAPLALTFVVDVSGSMKEEQRLDLVKHALRQLVGQLDARDSIAIVAFSTDSRLILPMTSAGQRGLIESAIEPLQPDGNTNTEAGLRMGYEQALSALTKNATNRVVLLTDGVANVGITDPNALVQTVERQRKAGIYLNTVGVGMDNHNDNLLEQLANKGDGLCNYVDDAAEVKHALVDNFLQALIPIARDAKVQVEFDPAQVESYRLLGYENRAIADRDFRNDKVDAGEINSGHQITALYEIVRSGNLQNQDAPLAKVHVRFKAPHKDGVAQAGGDEASEISSPVFARNAAASFDATSFGYRRAVLAAQFAEFLRRSVHARGDSLDGLIADLQKLAGEKNDAEVAELSDMVVKSKALLQSEFSRRGELDHAVYSLRNSCFERARLEALNRESDRESLKRMDEQVAALESTVRELLERRLK